MASSTILNGTREWIRTQCPSIDKANKFNVNFLGSAAVNYSVDLVPTQPIYKSYMRGRKLAREQIQNFVFSARMPYSENISENLAAAANLWAIAEWMQEQNELGNLPTVDDVTILAAEITGTPYPIAANADSADYQIQFSLHYNN